MLLCLSVVIGLESISQIIKATRVEQAENNKEGVQEKKDFSAVLLDETETKVEAYLSSGTPDFQTHLEFFDATSGCCETRRSRTPLE